MITIIKGNEKIVCTKGTFEEQYKSLGYQIASENKGATKDVAPIVESEEKEEAKVLKDLKENQIKEETKINEKYKLGKKKERK